MITSTSNTKVTLVRNLLQNKRNRNREGYFVAEGVRLIEEAFRSQISPQLVLYSNDLSERGMSLIAECSNQNIPVFEVSGEIMDQVTKTETTQGIMGVFPLQTRLFPRQPNFLLLVDGVRDPGNLGTLLRSAWAAGVDGVITTEGTVDLFSPKVVRAGMGAHFAIPLWEANWKDVLEQFPPGNPLYYFATIVDGGVNFWDCDLTVPGVFMIGAEADGMSPIGSSVAQQTITIPMAAQTESLNAGIAGSLVLFEVLRQRSHGH